MSHEITKNITTIDFLDSKKDICHNFPQNFIKKMEHIGIRGVTLRTANLPLATWNFCYCLDSPRQ